MCQPIEHLMFCTCADEVKVKTVTNRYGDTYTQKVFPKHIHFIWTLQRYSNERNLFDGMMEFPASILAESLNTNEVLKQLNNRDCFDFDYVPQEGDNLIISSNKGHHGYLSFLFENNQWNKGYLSPFNFILKVIEEGKVDCRE